MLAHVASATYPSSSPYLRLPRKVVTFSVSILLSFSLTFGLYLFAHLRAKGAMLPTRCAWWGYYGFYNEDKVGSNAVYASWRGESLTCALLVGTGVRE